MLRISAFYGIVITMHFDDHEPPHFHATYGEHEARILIESLKPMDAGLPARALRLIARWGSLHQDGLRANWEHARFGRSLDKIEPLP